MNMSRRAPRLVTLALPFRLSRFTCLPHSPHCKMHTNMGGK
jgi:hypothetical protein